MVTPLPGGYWDTPIPSYAIEDNTTEDNSENLNEGKCKHNTLAVVDCNMDCECSLDYPSSDECSTNNSDDKDNSTNTVNDEIGEFLIHNNEVC